MRSNLKAAQEQPLPLFATLLRLLDPSRLLFGPRIIRLLIQHQQVEVGPVMLRSNLEGSRQIGLCEGK